MKKEKHLLQTEKLPIVIGVSNGGEGETRTLAPVTRPTPLAGAPRHQLEYFSIGNVFIAMNARENHPLAKILY